MTLAEDARRLANPDDAWCDEACRCHWCDTPDGGHQTDCPWLSMPKIVAALEAAERVAAVWEADLAGRGDEPISPYIRLAHLGPLFNAACALVAALRGEKVQV